MIPKVSIVVPMYGVEPFLNKCVDSLLAQSLHDIEIILVDDGSPDRCGEIAEEYAIKDNRVKVIHQKNSGLGPARNTGMAAATGEYIGFVDSDDWANNCMFERLYNAAKKNNADIAVGGHCDWREGKVIRSKRHPLAGKTVMDRSEIDEIRRNLYGRSIDDATIIASLGYISAIGHLLQHSRRSAWWIDVLCGDEGKKTSIKLDEIVIYWKR